jgi:hypothetical protein
VRVLVLALIVGVAALLHGYLALRSPVPWAFPDELRYSELAKSLADGGLPKIRDDVTFGFGLGYPLLLAPVWAIFDDVSAAYSAAKLLNALVLALTAVPAYFLALRFLDARRAIVVSALSVCVPSLLYAGTLMTEVALYPTFVLALLAIAVALERPTARAQLAALAAIGLASSVKTLAATLFVAYAVGILLFQWLDTRERESWRERLRSYALTWIALAALLVAGIVAAVLTGSASGVLGAYEANAGRVDPLDMPYWLGVHVAAFDLFLALIPFAATAIVAARGLRGPSEREERLFAVLVLCASASLFLAVASYSSDDETPPFGYASGAGANERASFMLAPLFFVGLLMWLRRPGSVGRLAAVAFTAALLPAVIPLDRFEENGNISIQAFALVPWVRSSLWPLGALVLTFGLAAVMVVASRRARSEILVVGAVAAVLVSVTVIAQPQLELSSERARAAGIGEALTWVDDAVGDDSVSVLWYERPGMDFAEPAARHRVVWLDEFFNRQVGTVFEIGSPMPYGPELEATPVSLEDGAVRLVSGAPAPLGPIVLAPCHVRVVGTPIARDDVTGARLVRVSGVVRVSLSEPGSCP